MPSHPNVFEKCTSAAVVALLSASASAGDVRNTPNCCSHCAFVMPKKYLGPTNVLTDNSNPNFLQKNH